MYDYEEHFIISYEKNKAEEEISEALGNPVQIANVYKADGFIKKPRQISVPTICLKPYLLVSDSDFLI